MPALAGLAFFLAAILLAVDLLAGGITWGAHLDLPALGPTPLLLVDLLGLAAYFALLFIPAAIIFWLGRLRHRPDRLAPGLAVPLAIIALAVIILQVGRAIPGTGSLPVLTAFMAAIVVILMFYLPRLENYARTAPGRLALAGLTFPITTRLVFAIVGRLPLGEWNRAAQFGLVVVIAIIALSGLFLRQRIRPCWRAPGAKRLTGIIGILLIALLVVWGGPKIFHRQKTDAQGPNVVLVVFDALRADRLAPYGGKVPTPHFDALVAKGVLFEQAHSQAPATRYSMASAFASRTAEEVHGTITKEDTTLAQILQAKGYATGVVCANLILNPGTGILNGFSEQVIFNSNLRYRNIFSLELPGLEALMGTVVKPPAPGGLLDNAQVIMRHLNSFLACHSRQPYFLWAHFVVPHDPYDPPAKFRPQWAGKPPWPVFAPHNPDLNTPTEGGIRAGHDVLTPGEKEYVKELYNGEVAYADELLGEVEKAINRAPAGRETIICVIADHGEEFWDHGNMYHGQSLYEELLHVPLIISAPGAAPGLRVKERVALMDLMPTLCDLCGVPVSPTFKGRSLAGRLKAGSAPLPLLPIYSEKNIYYDPLQSIIFDHYKLIRPVAERTPVQLFDLDQDPKEQNNLAAKLPQVAQQLTARLDARLKRMPVDKDASKKQKHNMQDLKSLGYL